MVIELENEMIALWDNRIVDGFLKAYSWDFMLYLVRAFLKQIQV